MTKVSPDWGFSPLDVRELGGGEWELLADLVYTTKSGQRITVPKGFVTDFFSIPPIVRAFLPSVEPHNEPAVLHDWVYQHILQGWKVFTRAQCDCLLLEAMEFCQFGWIRRNSIYYGVRIGGGLVWEGYRSKENNT